METTVIQTKKESHFNWLALSSLIVLSGLAGYFLLSPLQNFGTKTFAFAGFLIFNLTIYLILQDFEDTILFLAVFFMSFMIQKHFGSEYYREKYMIYNPAITFSDILTMLLATVWFIRTVSQKESLALRPQFLVRTLLLLTAIAISMKNAVEPFQARVGLLTFAKGFLLYLFFQNYLNRRQRYFLVLIALALGGCIQGFVGIGQQLAHSNFGLESTNSITHTNEFRVVGMLATSARYSQYLNFVFFIPLITILMTRKTYLRYLAGVAFFLIFAGILFSFARTTWIAAFVGALLVIFMLRKRISPGNLKTIFFFLWLTLLGVLIFSFLFFEQISDRITQLETRGDNLQKSRIIRGEISLNMIEEYPYFGVGINNATENYLKFDYKHLLYPERANLSYVHNNYLLIGSEIGLVGLSFYLILVFSLIRAAWRLSRSKDNLIAALGTFIFASFISFSLSGITVAYPGNPFVILFWFYLALVASLTKFEQQKKRTRETE